jgi:hypothetical protein
VTSGAPSSYVTLCRTNTRQPDITIWHQRRRTTTNGQAE